MTSTQHLRQARANTHTIPLELGIFNMAVIDIIRTLLCHRDILSLLSVNRLARKLFMHYRNNVFYVNVDPYIQNGIRVPLQLLKIKTSNIKNIPQGARRVILSQHYISDNTKGLIPSSVKYLEFSHYFNPVSYTHLVVYRQ